MVDLMLSFFRKLIEALLIVVFMVGLYNFIRTPGGFTERMMGTYQRTSEQGGTVVKAGTDMISSESTRIVRQISGGILEKEKQRAVELRTQS